MKKVLLCDDEPDIIHQLKRIIEKEGFEVITAGDGSEALEVMRETHPDLILSDIAMPGMNGYQFYHRVRGEDAWVWIPFIFITARDSALEVRYERELGADDYLVKPFAMEDLLAAVLRTLPPPDLHR